MEDYIASLPTPSSCRSHSRQAPNRSADALARKRERDKDNQRKKRQREREHIADLEAKVRCLERKLGEVNTLCTGYVTSSPARQIDHTSASDASYGGRRGSDNYIATPSMTNEVISTASISLPGSALSPVDYGSITPNTSSSLTSKSTAASSQFRTSPDSINVSFTLLDKLIVSPDWNRPPAWSLSRPSENYRFLKRGTAFAPLLVQLRADPAVEEACPPVVRALDLLFGGSGNPLANFVHSEVVDLPFLPPEKFGAMSIIYLYLRACAPH